MKKYKELLYLARAALEAKLSGKKLDVPDDIKKKYSEKGACFVTLTKKGDLRGCIGSLEAHQALWKDVVDNAVSAGFSDYRFNGLDEDELEQIKIEVSVLSKPEKMGKGEDVIDKIDKSMGIVLKKQGMSATFLPQVWEQIPNKEVFLEELAMKAGLFKDDWKESEISFYRVEKVEE